MSEIVGYELVGDISESDRALAESIIRESLSPCRRDVLRRELARLRAVTVSRDVGDDLKLTMVAYAEELSRYPEKIVIAACRKRWKFWPALSELLDVADPMMRELLGWQEVLQCEPRTNIPPTRRELTEEEARRIASNHLKAGYSVVVANGRGGHYRFTPEDFAAE